MKKPFIFLLFLSFCISQTTACVAQNHLKDAISLPASYKEEGKAAVDAILDAYKNPSSGELEMLVFDGFIPNKYEFLNRVDQEAVDKTILNIKYDIEKAFLNKDKLSVEFDWDRTFVRKDNGAQIKDSGTTNFIFIKSDGAWRLYKIIGANVF